jgi:2,3-bisphosphoglycerate-independent phosphoglycerate mutase
VGPERHRARRVEQATPGRAQHLQPGPTVPGAELDPDGGILADVAPTALELLGIEQPAAMTGRSLLRR